MSRVGRHSLLTVVAAVLLTGGVALVSGTAAHASREGLVGGIVSTTAVGPIPFGSSLARVVAWAGQPGFTSVVGDPWNHYPIPRHDKNAYVMGYECKGLTKRQVCHTLFGFRDNRLTAFMTGSATFAFPNGVKPGMTDLAFQKREPKAKTVAGCPALRRLPAPAGTSRYVNLGFTRHGFFSSSRWGVYDLYAFSGHPVFTLVFKLKDGDFLCG